MFQELQMLIGLEQTMLVMGFSTIEIGELISNITI
jgi:hypothetical protein